LSSERPGRPVDENELWLGYHAGRSREAYDRLVEHYLPLVKVVAGRLALHLPSSVREEDLYSAGCVGLLSAVENFDPARDVRFETYALGRIRGAMLDEVRKSDWTPRSVHRTVREMSEVVRRIENETGREARASDIAAALGISVEEYHRAIADAASCRLFSFDQMGSSDDDGPVAHARDDNPGPQDDLEEEDFRKALGTAIEGLPEREKLVLSLYYDDELNLREIGAVLDVSESRVCQIHGQALVRLRARMEDWRQGR
jgi:RNA polymerase sigma factor for flagellar operon FliA